MLVCSSQIPKILNDDKKLLPDGCFGMDNVFGRCCGGSLKKDKKGNRVWEAGCGGYVGGKPALEHYREGNVIAEETSCQNFDVILPL